MGRNLVAPIGLALLLSAPSCRNKSETPPPAQQPAVAAMRDSTVVPPPPAIVGVWTIVAHHIPDVSAMTASQADGWIGRSIRLSANEVVSEGARCDRPSYTKLTLDRDNFLEGDFNLPPGAIMRLASVDNVNIIDVTCDGTPLQALGRLIIEVDADHVLSPWDGVFFELERDHDLRALGQSWSLDIIKGREMRLTRPGHADLVLPAPSARIDPQTGRRSYHAASEQDDLLVVIDATRCPGSMSGNTSESAVTLTLNGEVFHGCGGPRP